MLLRTEMEAGHGGVSGRYDRWRQSAVELAWLADQLGAEEDLPRATGAPAADPHESAPSGVTAPDAD